MEKARERVSARAADKDSKYRYYVLSAAVIAASARLGLHTDPELIAELEGEVFSHRLQNEAERERERSINAAVFTEEKIKQRAETEVCL